MRRGDDGKVERVRLGPDSLVTDRWTLAEQLWAFGEDDLSERVLTVPDRQLIDVFKHAARLFSDGDARTGAVALAMAVVAALEGRQRPLARRRRRPKRDAPVFAASLEDRLDEMSRLQALL
jgi:hypothetical protein